MTTVVASGVLVAVLVFFVTVVCFHWKSLLTSDCAWRKTSVSLINQVAGVGQQHVFGLQGKVLGLVHVSEAHTCYTSLTAEYAPGVLYAHGYHQSNWKLSY